MIKASYSNKNVLLPLLLRRLGKKKGNGEKYSVIDALLGRSGMFSIVTLIRFAQNFFMEDSFRTHLYIGLMTSE